MIHIWHEDSQNSTTSQFWNFLKVNKVSKLLVNADIQGFNGNDKLCAYLTTVIFNSNDIYYIFIDKVLDNNLALKYYLSAKKIVRNHKNVKLVDILCFEYLLLKFKYFVSWTTPVKMTKDYKICEQVRTEFIHCIETKQSWIHNNQICNFVMTKKNINNSNGLGYISSENVATLILSLMTNGGTTEFGISKTKFGGCWHQDCCFKYKNSTMGKVKCRMYRYKKTSNDKAKNLWNNTDARRIIENK